MKRIDDAVLVRCQDGDERWTTRVYRAVSGTGGTIREVYAYRDVLTDCHYPPAKITEVREGAVEIRAVEVANG